MSSPVGLKYSVLDHGYIEVIDNMGDDFHDVATAARTSYGDGTVKKSTDRGLIRHLLRNKHTSPMEMMEIKLYVKLPIFVARQFVRHRTANLNEYSLRYSTPKDTFYIPEISQICGQSKTNKQGRSERISVAAATAIQKAIVKHSENSMSLYRSITNTTHEDTYLHDVLQAVFEDDNFPEDGIARELARMVLPVNLYTEWYWKNDLNNYLKFLGLRADPHAQYEVREYAHCMEDILKAWVPEIYEAYIDYVKEAVTLSGPEVAMLRKVFHVNSQAAGQMREQIMQFRQDDVTKHRLSQREADSLYNIFGF